MTEGRQQQDRPRVSIAIVGAGIRGGNYARYATSSPSPAKVVAVAEPDPQRRQRFAEQYGIPESQRFETWRQMAQGSRVADAVIIATQDAMHVEPALAFLDQDYHILLEKPMAPSLEDCRRITAAAVKSKGLFAVCHVLRYTPFTRKLRELLDQQVIGQLVSLVC